MTWLRSTLFPCFCGPGCVTRAGNGSSSRMTRLGFILIIFFSTGCRTLSRSAGLRMLAFAIIQRQGCLACHCSAWTMAFCCRMLRCQLSLRHGRTCLYYGVLVVRRAYPANEPLFLACHRHEPHGIWARDRAGLAAAKQPSSTTGHYSCAASMP